MPEIPVAPVFTILRPSTRIQSIAEQSSDAYDDYINLPPRPCGSPIAWWQAHRNEYPRLSKVALDLFAIPMMSAECERVFSAAKNLITERQMRLRDDIIESMSF